MSVVAIQDQVKRLAIPGYGDDEVEFIVKALEIVKPKEIFEWGTCFGSSARIFWEAKEMLRLSCEIHTTELPIELAAINSEHAGTNTGVVFSQVEGICQHEGDGVTESLIVYKRLGSPTSLFYVDGDHSKENVLRELRWINAVAPNAAILMHDVAEGGLPHSHTHGPFHALVQFLENECDAYEVEILYSQAGMALLLP